MPKGPCRTLRSAPPCARESRRQTPRLIVTFYRAGIDRSEYLRRWRHHQLADESATTEAADYCRSTSIEQEDRSAASSTLRGDLSGSFLSTEPDSSPIPLSSGDAFNEATSPFHGHQVTPIVIDLLNGVMPTHRCQNVYEEAWEPDQFESGSPAWALCSMLRILSNTVNEEHEVPTWEQLAAAEDVLSFVLGWFRRMHGYYRDQLAKADAIWETYEALDSIYRARAKTHIAPA